MKLRTIMMALALSFSVGAGSGCILHAKDNPDRSQHRSKKRSHKKKKDKKCRPSHYWDGEKCRHKGKGKGARKHDY